MLIKEVRAKAIKDSRNELTIEVSVNGGPVASAPSGKSTGKYETKPYNQSLNWNIDFLNNWKKWVDVTCFEELSRVEEVLVEKAELKNVKEFGANALYAFESAILKALAKEQKKELWDLINSKAKKMPIPVGNAVGGGLHSEKLGAHPVFQEFLLIPHEKSFVDNVTLMSDVYIKIGKDIKSRVMNDEGAWYTPIGDEVILKTLSKYIKQIDIGIDIAASSFYKKGLYDYKTIKRTRQSHIEHILKLIKMYDVFYVEDPVEEGDFEGFGTIKKGDREAIIVGDDLTATHIDRLENAIKLRSIGGIIIKPNQNGSLVEVKKIVDLCKQHNIKTIFSHRSGETMDDAIADYAFAFQTDFVKFGIATKWREAKLKRLIEIEETLEA